MTMFVGDVSSPYVATASFVDGNFTYRNFGFSFDGYTPSFELIKPTAFWLGEFLLSKSDIISLRFELVK